MSEGEVLVIYTGGTIGMVNAEEGNPASPLIPVPDGKKLTARVPQLRELREDVPYDVVPLRNAKGDVLPAIDSSDINISHWSAMAAQIKDSYEDYDGFVILHGTDTMAYTASALSFMLRYLAKPVVVTGSQIPISRYDTDGIWNFVRAVQIAGYRKTGLPLVPEVTICFDDCLFRGNRVRKMSTSAAQGFGSPNYPVLGEIGEHVRIYRERLMTPADNSVERFGVDTKFDPSVLDFGLFPGLNPRALERILEMDDVKGMVLRTFGAGNAPADANRPEDHMKYPGLVEILAKAVDNGKVIVNVTPCPEGQVEAGLYAASSALLENGVLSGLDMTPEAALTKLMWLLANETDAEEVRSQMQISQRGELTESLVEVKYTLRTDAPEHGPVTESSRPQGVFVKTQLSRAVLRVSGLKVAGDPATQTSVGVFLNYNEPSGLRDKEIAGVLSSKTPQCVITGAVMRAVDERRAISVTLLAEDHSKVEFDSMALALFTRS